MLRRGGLQYIYNSSENGTDGWTVESSLTDTFTISLSDSNTYNALIELSILTDSIIKINYANKIIRFYSKDDPIFIKNYKLSPNLNLEDLSLDYNGDEFYSLLYVEGGEDDYGLNVGLTPTLPDFFLEANWDNIRFWYCYWFYIFKWWFSFKWILFEYLKFF